MKVMITRPKRRYDNFKDVELISWEELMQMNKERLIVLEQESLDTVRKYINEYHDYEYLLPVSMGKDSQVTSYLVRKVVPDMKAIFSNTSLDCADTYRMAKKFPNCTILNPEQGFYQYIKQINLVPNRLTRFCCRIFKVGAMVDKLDKKQKTLLFMGMRNEESNARSDYGDIVVSPEWGKTEWLGILPIREWSELDIWLFTFLRGLEINPKYKKGYTRVGCAIACPYYNKAVWALDKYWYPKQRQRWEDYLRQEFISNNKWLIMNCTIEEYVDQAWSGGVFRPEPTEEVIQEFADHNEIDLEVAEKYFNKYCTNGCKNKIGKPKKLRNKDTLSMNMKLHGRNTGKFLCKSCLMEMYNMDEQQWNEQIERFKQEGCSLFVGENVNDD